MKNSFCAWALILSICFPLHLSGNEPIIESQDRDRIELFLKHVLIEEIGMYTIMGSKPMTSFACVPIIDEREKRELYAEQTDQFRKHILFAKFRPSKDDVRKLWRDWRKVEHKYLGEPFLIREDSNYDGILINILSVTYILEKYLVDFEKVTGETIVPKTFVYRIGESGDPAWERIKKDHYLMGLLLGFGEKNAKYFAWETEKRIHYPQRRSTSFSPAGTGKAAHELLIHDLDLPRFISYQIIDEQVERFRLEQSKCIEFFEGEDFCELAVSILKGQPPQPQKKMLSEESMRLIRECSGYNSR